MHVKALGNIAHQEIEFGRCQKRGWILTVTSIRNNQIEQKHFLEHSLLGVQIEML